jgi:glucose-1-phosphate adenylyltransferase
MNMRPHVLSMVLAGGEGSRLQPLTRDRAKPAVPFGGSYRLVDFVLSNLANAGYRRIAVLTQYKSHSLDRHIALTWQLSHLLGEYVASIPAQMRQGPRWFAGSADAVFQNFNLIDDERPGYVLIFGADHVYRMDPQQMVAAHIATGAGVTVATVRVPVEEASAFGVIEADWSGKILSFLEKPESPPALPGDPRFALASMGNYVFSTAALRDVLAQDAANEDSAHDIGGDIVPALVQAQVAYAYDFASNVVPGQSARERGYWRDVGTLDAFYEANMDLVAVEPTFDLYNQEWPIYSYRPQLPPAKLVLEQGERAGRAFDSLIAPGVIISGGTTRRSVLSPGVRVHSHALIEDSVLFDGVEVGRGAVVRRAVIDKGVVIPDGMRIGVDPEHDRARFTVSDRGVTVLGKRERLD